MVPSSRSIGLQKAVKRMEKLLEKERKLFRIEEMLYKPPPAKADIAATNRIDAYVRVETYEDQLIKKSKYLNVDLIRKLDFLINFKVCLKTESSNSRLDKEMKRKLETLLEVLIRFLISYIEVYAEVDEGVEEVIRSHVFMYHFEDSFINYEENLVFFFKQNRLINKDLENMAHCLLQLNFLKELSDISDLVISKSNPSNNITWLKNDPFLAFSPMESEINKFLEKFDKGIIIFPGEKELPLNFDVKRFNFNKRRN